MPAYPPVRHYHHKVEATAVSYPVYQPLVQPTVAYQPVAPSVTYQPLAQPTVAYEPQISCAVPQVAYRPVARYQPYLAATYVTAGYGAPAAMAPVPGAPRVVVHPKVYVQGEPIRNLIKAITP